MFLVFLLLEFHLRIDSQVIVCETGYLNLFNISKLKLVRELDYKCIHC